MCHGVIVDSAAVGHLDIIPPHIRVRCWLAALHPSIFLVQLCYRTSYFGARLAGTVTGFVSELHLPLERISPKVVRLQ